MKQTVRSPSRIDATVAVAGDKSISQRALILNAIASGTAHVSNLCVGDDRSSILRCLDGFGVRIERHESCPVSGADECFEVEGVGAEGLREPETVLDAGNSGTAFRLLSGLAAGQPFLSIMSGDESLRKRPMTRIVDPLTRMGARIAGRSGGALPPLAIQGGGLTGIEYEMPMASAQVKSAVLIAGLFADGLTTVAQPAESRDHTERMLRWMGADIDVDGLSVSVRSVGARVARRSCAGRHQLGGLLDRGRVRTSRGAHPGDERRLQPNTRRRGQNTGRDGREGAPRERAGGRLGAHRGRRRGD